MARRYYVYIMASRSLNLYTGVTSNLKGRVFQHKVGLVEGFTKRYRIDRLVYFAALATPREAISWEKRIKSWRREKKLMLIRSANPGLLDLAEDWYDKKQVGKSEMQIPRCARDDKRGTEPPLLSFRAIALLGGEESAFESWLAETQVPRTKAVKASG
jgi:putative endonuclease